MSAPIIPPVNPPGSAQARRAALLAKPVLTDADLDELATITPEDLVAAAEWWRQNAPKKFKGLLDAKDVEAQ
jgi:hypothetical protein